MKKKIQFEETRDQSYNFHLNAEFLINSWLCNHSQRIVYRTGTSLLETWTEKYSDLKRWKRKDNNR